MLSCLQSLKGVKAMLLYDFMIFLNVQIPKEVESFSQNIIIMHKEVLKAYPITEPMLCDPEPIQRNKQGINCQKIRICCREMEIIYAIIGEANMQQIMKCALLERSIGETFIQIHGSSLINLKTNFKKNSDHKIHRSQIFYCTYQARNVGFFKKNFIGKARNQIQQVISDKSLITPQFIAIKAASNLLDDWNQNHVLFNGAELTNLRLVLEKMFVNIQTIKIYKLFIRHAPLPQNYSIQKEHPDYDTLYESYVPKEFVIQLMEHFTIICVPQELFGYNNRNEFIRVLQNFIKMKRFEDQLYSDYLQVIDVFQVPWMSKHYNNKTKHYAIKRKQIQLEQILKFLFQHIYIPFIRHNFYVTTRHKDEQSIFYYRKEIWRIITNKAMSELVNGNYQRITRNAVLPGSYIAKLRIMPKPGTFRPITTYQRKSKNKEVCLAQKLFNTKLVLRNLKSQLGYSVFDNYQVFQRLEAFNKIFNKDLTFLNVDVRKCYDSIELDRLVSFIKKSGLFESIYLINKYTILTRNSRTAIGSMRCSFNAKQLAHAMRPDQLCHPPPVELNRPAIIMNTKITSSITLFQILSDIKAICQNNVIQFEKMYFLQRKGIPQGLNISGILCSLYLWSIEKTFNNLGLLMIMRFTDDYCCIGDRKSVQGCEGMFRRIEQKYNLEFSLEKRNTNLYHNQQCRWVGKLIHTNQLQILPVFCPVKSIYLNYFRKFLIGQCQHSDQATYDILTEEAEKPNPESIQILFPNRNQHSLNKVKSFEDVHNTRVNEVQTISLSGKGLAKEAYFKFALKYCKGDCILLSLEWIFSVIFEAIHSQVLQKGDQKRQIFANIDQLLINMNQKFYNFLNLPLESGSFELLQQKVIKQILVAQVLFVLNTWAKQKIVFGLIGCGAVGKLIINSVIPYAIKYLNLQSSDVHISTRRPEQIHYYEKMGYKIYFDNERLMKTCNFVVLAFPPVADHWNILELQPQGYILALLSTLNVQKARSLLKTHNIFTTQITNLDKTMIAYQELIQAKKTGLFPTQLLEDLTRILIDESYAHFFTGDRLEQFMESLQLTELDNPKSQFQKVIFQYMNFAQQ